MNWSRLTGFFILFIAILTAVIYGFWPKPVLVDVMEVTCGPMTVTVEEEGKTRVIDRFIVSAPVAGFARRVELDVGDSVTQGHVLVDLEPLRSDVLDPRSRAEANAKVAAAKSAMRVAQENSFAARADADLAVIEYERKKRLRERASISQEEFDRAEALARRTEAVRRSVEFTVEVARFELDAALTALEYSAARNDGMLPEKVAIKSPVNGQVLQVYHQSEGVVNVGQALVEIGDARALEVEIDVLSSNAVRIASGTRVLFDRWGGKQKLEGRVRVVEPVGFTKASALGVEEQRVLVVADITSEPKLWKRLGHGYRVEASFILWEGENIIQIPSSALFRKGEQWAVFVFENNRAVLRKIEVGQHGGLMAEVISGLAQGEQVITHPDDTINDGIRVCLRPRS
ncbi:MAG TPA: efflux RND transporter periplasmic adaptor subunit [Anaerolineae bacterium]|nr:efflux RND transporter periplasmic adaptor subunit [Anaerolineae bacterium]